MDVDKTIIYILLIKIMKIKLEPKKYLCKGDRGSRLGSPPAGTVHRHRRGRAQGGGQEAQAQLCQGLLLPGNVFHLNLEYKIEDFFDNHVYPKKKTRSCYTEKNTT